MSERKNLIKDGSLTITGKTHDGKDVEVTADVKDLIIEVEDQYDGLPSIYGNYGINSNQFLTPKQKIIFHMEVKDTYTVRVPSANPVERTARVRVDSMTPGAIVEAARIAAVDTETEFVYVTEGSGKTAKHYIEFRWTDK